MRSISKYRILIVTALVLFLCLNSTAQRRNFRYASSNKPLSYGATAGINLTNFDIEHSSSSGYIYGYQAGGFIAYNFVSDFSGQLDVKFISLGGENIPFNLLFNPSSPILSNVNNIDLRMFGVELPIAVKYTIPQISPSLYVSAGLAGMYIFKAQAHLEQTVNTDATIPINTTSYVDVQSKIQDLQMGVLLGVGAKFPVGDISIITDLGFCYGITDISANNVVENNAFRSKSFRLSVGVAF